MVGLCKAHQRAKSFPKWLKSQMDDWWKSHSEECLFIVLFYDNLPALGEGRFPSAEEIDALIPNILSTMTLTSSDKILLDDGFVSFLLFILANIFVAQEFF